MDKRIVLLIMLGFSLAVGGGWASQAQDPPAQMPRADQTAAQTVLTDLSGTYAGIFNCEALGLIGDTTLTINGNEFTTADGKTGRIVASTTAGYTAVVLQVGGMDPTASPPTIVSMRARKSGNRLTLTPIAGAAQSCTFTPARNVVRTRRTPSATGTEVSNPATKPSEVPVEIPVPAQTPSPSPTPSPEPIPSPTPEEPPVPSPTPAEPMPSPTPAEPAPSPTASPSPTPTPSPSRW